MIIVIHQRTDIILAFLAYNIKEKKKITKIHEHIFIPQSIWGSTVLYSSANNPPPPVLPRFPHVFLAFSREVVCKNCLLGIYTLFFGPKADDTFGQTIS